MKLFGEKKQKMKSLMYIKKTGISIERFKKIVRREKYAVVAEKYFLFNPIYKYKYNLKATRQCTLIARIPYLRNFLTTAVYFIIKAKNQN